MCIRDSINTRRIVPLARVLGEGGLVLSPGAEDPSRPNLVGLGLPRQWLRPRRQRRLIVCIESEKATRCVSEVRGMQLGMGGVLRASTCIMKTTVESARNPTWPHERGSSPSRLAAHGGSSHRYAQPQLSITKPMPMGSSFRRTARAPFGCSFISSSLMPMSAGWCLDVEGARVVERVALKMAFARGDAREDRDRSAAWS